MTSSRSVMTIGTVMTVAALMGTLCGAAMLAFASAFGTETQAATALAFLEVSAAIVVLGVALVLIALTLRYPTRESRR